MNEHSLFENFQQSPLLNSLADRIAMFQHQPKPLQIFLQNTQGASIAFILQTIFSHPATQDLNHLVVLNDAEKVFFRSNNQNQFISINI